MYDWFISKLRCHSCVTTSPATSATNMQTHLRDDADGSELGVGAQLDPLDVRTGDILASGYQLVAQPEPGELIRLLEMWECPACNRSDNWAMITLRGASVPSTATPLQPTESAPTPSIESIDAVTLDLETLERAHFISDACEMFAARLAGLQLKDLNDDVSCVELLREHLP